MFETPRKCLGEERDPANVIYTQDLSLTHCYFNIYYACKSRYYLRTLTADFNCFETLDS